MRPADMYAIVNSHGYILGCAHPRKREAIAAYIRLWNPPSVPDWSQWSQGQKWARAKRRFGVECVKVRVELAS